MDSCANSPLARAELLVHRAAKTSSTFFPPPLISLEPGAPRSGEGPQFYKLPKPAGSLHSKNGEKGFHLFLRGARSRFVWEEWSSGEGFGLHLEFIELCFLHVASPPWKGFGSDLLRFMFSNQFKKKKNLKSWLFRERRPPYFLPASTLIGFSTRMLVSMASWYISLFSLLCCVFTTFK